ncbi:MAG: hypothetical protein WC538_21085 [Thermoanaerobaculia bacterium]|jgi:hypothetical protein
MNHRKPVWKDVVIDALRRLPPGTHHLLAINESVRAVRVERALGFARTWQATVRRVLQELRPALTSTDGKGNWTFAARDEKTEPPKA